LRVSVTFYQENVSSPRRDRELKPPVMVSLRGTT
jgi:hypothetical protein